MPTALLKDPSELSALISDEQIEAVRQIPHLRDGFYHQLNARHALDFYFRRYVQQLPYFAEISEETTIADIGGGYGWLAMALAFATPARIIMVEPDAERLEAGREAARILGLADDRIDWRVGQLGSLPMTDAEADIVYCIEVLEHVYRDRTAIPDLVRVTGKTLIVTTPNLWFPVVAHDTRLPFCHWLPMPLRRIYAAAAGRSDSEHNKFYSPRTLERQMPGFRRVSPFLHYPSLQAYLDTYPCNLPYGPGGNQHLPGIGKAKRSYYRLASRLGRRSHLVMPSLAGVYIREN